MTKNAMDSVEFEGLLSRINQETGSTSKKVEILFTSRGFFSALQASRILYAIGIPSDKVRAIQIMEPRLCRMTCSEARDIIGAMGIQNDKLRALECVKRVLSDCQFQQGLENILGAFPFENDKLQALAVLHTVSSNVADGLAAGGHQGYAALGALYTQSRPLVPHLYGSIAEQEKHKAGYGAIELPVEAKPGVVPSMYTGHPSYTYPQGRTYAEDRGFPGNAVSGDYSGMYGSECPARPGQFDNRVYPIGAQIDNSDVYPTGAQLLGQH